MSYMSYVEVIVLRLAFFRSCKTASPYAQPGIQMHQYFGSRFLNDLLSKHGFCVSYSKVLKYKHCAAAH